MTTTDFKAAYSGDALVITNNSNDKQLTSGTKLTNEEMQKIKGMGSINVPKTIVKWCGIALIGAGIATADPIVVVVGISTVASAYS